MRYALSVEVKLQELADDEPRSEDQSQPGSDPMVGIQNLMSNATKLLTRPPAYVFPMQPAGLDFRRQVAVSVRSFEALAKIIQQYDALTMEIELERV